MHPTDYATVPPGGGRGREGIVRIREMHVWFDGVPLFALQFWRFAAIRWPQLSREAGLVHIGFFGGSFDPPHICHALFCVYALEITGVEKVLWVPCADHPFGKPMAPFEHRLAMSRLAAESLGARVEVLDIEAHLPRPNYTIHTIEALRRRAPQDRLSILIGSDLLGEVDQWEQIDRLREQVDFLVVPRGGYGPGDDALAPALPRVSSTAVREALRAGRAVERVLTPAVREYIVRHNLYRD